MRHCDTSLSRGQPALSVPGFTLIELLVVISIISLLIAVLLPALGKARVRAQTLTSMSQVRQVTLALHTYTNDNEGFLPYARFWNPGQTGTSAEGLYWSNKLLVADYVNTPRIFWSPARLTHGLPFTTLINVPTTSLMTYTGFSANTAGAMQQERFVGGVSVNRTLRPGSGIKEPPPSKHVILSEQYRAVGTLLASGRDGWFAGFGSSSITSQKAFCYEGSLVRSYMDGHGAARDGADLNWDRIDDRNGNWLGNGNGAPWYDMNGTDFN